MSPTMSLGSISGSKYITRLPKGSIRKYLPADRSAGFLLFRCAERLSSHSKMSPACPSARNTVSGDDSPCKKTGNKRPVFLPGILRDRSGSGTASAAYWDLAGVNPDVSGVGFGPGAPTMAVYQLEIQADLSSGSRILKGANHAAKALFAGQAPRPVDK